MTSRVERKLPIPESSFFTNASSTTEMNEKILLTSLGDEVSSYAMVSAEDAIERLEQELAEVRLQLKEKDEKIVRLSLLQMTVDSEVQELTEKLFQEAYKMVNAAEERRERSEKLQRESKLKVDVLTAEVDALKLVLSSSGVGFNHHNNTSPLHQQKAVLAAKESSPFTFKFLNSSSKRSPIPTSSTFPVKSKSSSLPSTSSTRLDRVVNDEQRKADEVEEIDPLYFGEFSRWREGGHPMPSSAQDPAHPFLARIENEDVRPCMTFENTQLADCILKSIRENLIEIEPLNEQKPTVQTCVLSGVPRFCPYRVRVSADSEWILLSLLARNRIAAVCDFYTYLRYLSMGMLKCGVRDSYFDVIALRKNMALARLGLGFVPKTTLSRPGCGFH